MGSYLSRRREDAPLVGSEHVASPDALPDPRVLNWIADDDDDDGDAMYASTPTTGVVESAAARVSLRPLMPPVYDQGALGSCTANALAGAVAYDHHIETGEDFAPSRLFVYYNEREREGDVPDDRGAMLRDGVRSLIATGVCSESIWPYDTTHFADKPPGECYAAASAHRVTRYRKLSSGDDVIAGVRHALARGRPVVFGVQVFAGFMTAPAGVVPMPAVDESAQGGHAIMAVGYDDATERVQIRNSWGETWGDGGYGYLSYEYMRTYAASFWVLVSVEEGSSSPIPLDCDTGNDEDVVD